MILKGSFNKVYDVKHVNAIISLPYIQATKGHREKLVFISGVHCTATNS